MKIKTTLTFCVFFLLSLFLLKLNAHNLKANNFAIVNKLCFDDVKLIPINYKLMNKKKSNISSEVYIKDLSKKHQTSNLISLSRNESIKMKLKTNKKDNALLESWNCILVEATKLSCSKSKDSKKNISELVTIKTYIPDLINLGYQI